MIDTAASPFVRHRRLLDSYRRWIDDGGDDDEFVELVEQLDRAVAAVDGVGFTTTPFAPRPELAQAAGLDGLDVWVKDETGNVAGSHKGRHLFGLLLHLAAVQRHASASPRGDERPPLA